MDSLPAIVLSCLKLIWKGINTLHMEFIRRNTFVRFQPVPKYIRKTNFSKSIWNRTLDLLSLGILNNKYKFVYLNCSISPILILIKSYFTQNKVLLFSLKNFHLKNKDENHSIGFLFNELVRIWLPSVAWTRVICLLFSLISVHAHLSFIELHVERAANVSIHLSLSHVLNAIEKDICLFNNIVYRIHCTYIHALRPNKQHLDWTRWRINDRRYVTLTTWNVRLIRHRHRLPTDCRLYTLFDEDSDFHSAAEIQCERLNLRYFLANE